MRIPRSGLVQGLISEKRRSERMHLAWSLGDVLRLFTCHWYEGRRPGNIEDALARLGTGCRRPARNGIHLRKSFLA
jgi:hypothetical protein